MPRNAYGSIYKAVQVYKTVHIYKCLYCTHDFTPRNLGNPNKYCSADCRVNASRLPKQICAYCRNPFKPVRKYQIRKEGKRKSKYCSHECYSSTLIGKEVARKKKIMEIEDFVVGEYFYTATGRWLVVDKTFQQAILALKEQEYTVAVYDGETKEKTNRTVPWEEAKRHPDLYDVEIFWDYDFGGCQLHPWDR